MHLVLGFEASFTTIVFLSSFLLEFVYNRLNPWTNAFVLNQIILCLFCVIDLFCFLFSTFHFFVSFIEVTSFGTAQFHLAFLERECLLDLLCLVT